MKESTVDKKKFIDKKVRVLREFCVRVTPDMISHLETLYPSEILAEQYTRKIISQKLGS